MTKTNNDNQNKGMARPTWKRKRVVWPAAAVIIVVMLLVRAIVAPVGFGFIDNIVREQIEARLPSDEFSVNFTSAGLQLVSGIVPSIVLDEMTVQNRRNGAEIFAQRVAGSYHLPSAMLGKPALELSISGAKVQLVQDYDGIRLAKVLFEDGPDGDQVIRLQAEDEGAAAVRVTDGGVVALPIEGEEATPIRSDNAWAIEGVEAVHEMLTQFAPGHQNAMFRRLKVRETRVEVVDRIYQLYRRLEKVNVDVRAQGDLVAADLRFRTAGRETSSSVKWSPLLENKSQINGSFTDIDLALVLPFLDDQDGMFALKGGTNMDFGVQYLGGKVQHGAFAIDITPAKAAILDDQFVIAAGPAKIEWFPLEAKYVLAPYAVQIGQSSTIMSGEFKLGLDEAYGPTLGYAIEMVDTAIHPNDLDAPVNLIDRISAAGWSAPLYGAMGIDRIAFRDDRFQIDGRGRVDVLQRGLGFDITLFGQGATADDLKRIWPYFLATDAREWFVENVEGGRIETAQMRFNFPVGTVGKPGEDRRIPAGGVNIKGTAKDVELIPLPGFPTIEIDGTTKISVKDHHLEMGFDKAIVRDDSGEVVINNAAYLNRDSGAKSQIFEISGQLQGAVSTLVAIADREPLNLLEDFEVQYRPEDLTGDADVRVIATIMQDEGGEPKGIDYSMQGTVADFSSRVPVEGHMVSNGSVNFTASQAGYRIAGQANVGGIDADILVEAEGDNDPVVTASATLTDEKRKELGIDLSQFVEGPLRFVGRPAGETIQVAVDLTDAKLQFAELGISKKKGVKGELKATLLLDDKLVDAQTVDLRFAKVRAAGSLQYHLDDGLLSADIVDLVMNEGDKASVSMKPINGGFAVKVVGEQLDLKPMLKRFLGLGEGSTTQATSNAKNQIIDIEVKLDRALGFYKTTAYAMNAHLIFRGADFIRVDLQTSLGNTKVASVATNPVPRGRLMSAATNDLGTLLRFIGMYSRLLNGEASLALTIDTKDNRNSGEFVLTDFSLVDEDKVAQVMGNHRDSRSLIERQNRVNFKRAYVKFNRQGEVIAIEESALDGGTIGGTLRGAIYTNSRQYDLVGTYIPLFGLNNIFQKLPILGRLLGGRDGEGLIGVTFAIRGKLDDPQFSINPASILAPGVFRQIFEFRARGGDEAARRALEEADKQNSN